MFAFFYYIVNPSYPLQGPVTTAGNSYSAQPEILRYEGSDDLASEERAVHYSIKYSLGDLIPGTYTFRSFSTEQDFIIEWGPGPSPTPLHDEICIISGFTDITEGITLVLSGGKTGITTPGADGYYFFDQLKAGEEYTVTIMYDPPPPEVVITQPVDLSSVTGITEIMADVTSEVCMYEFIPPAYTYRELTSIQTNQDFTTGSPTDCCMSISRVDYVITGNSGQSDMYTDTTPSMCYRSYSHIWDASQFSDWNCTITVQVTDEAGKTDSDMISIFNDEYPTPTPTPGSIENPGAVWVSPKESIAAKDTTFTTDILANSGDLLIGAYGFELTYNPDVIQIVISRGLKGVDAGTEGFVAAVNAETPGILFFSGFDPSGTGPGTALQMAVVYWLAVEEGTSPINLRIDSLADSNAKGFEDPQGISGTVTVLPPGLTGDVNGDTYVDIVDALLTAQYYVGLDPAGFSPAYADANCDGNLDIVDALLIAQFYVGLIANLC